MREYIWLLKDQRNIGFGNQGTAFAMVADVNIVPNTYIVPAIHLNSPEMSDRYWVSAIGGDLNGSTQHFNL